MAIDLQLRTLLLAALVATGCGRKSSPATSPGDSNSSGNPVTAPVDYLGVVAKGQRKAHQTLDTLGVSQAIQIFHSQEGRFPKDLNELVTEGIISELPKPPAGMKFQYTPATGQVNVVPEP